MKKIKNGVMIALLVLLLSLMAAGCRMIVPNLNGEQSSTTTVTTQPTEPTEMVHTVQLVTKGGWPVADAHITVYADEALTQRITTIHTDFEGIATYTGPAGSTCYMVPDAYLKSLGYRAEPYYTVTEAFTALIVEIELLRNDYLVDPGEVMCEINMQDWDKEQFVLSDRIKEGKPCIIWCVGTSRDSHKQQLAQLQQLYRQYGNRLEIMLYVSRGYRYFVEQLRDECDIHYPIISAVQYDPDWESMNRLLVIDRYGLVALEDRTDLVNEHMLKTIATYFTDENYRQDRVFADCKELCDYTDSLKAEQNVTYRVKVVDGNGNPLEGIRLSASYPYGSFPLVTDEEGMASWTMYKRDDLEVHFSGEYDLGLYNFGNEGGFEPGATEKTMVLQERDEFTFTLRAMDMQGNPVKNVSIMTHPYGKELRTDENGLIQWESAEVAEPCTVNEREIPDGYIFDSVTREGHVYTVLLHRMIKHAIKVVDANGNPVTGVLVEFIEEDTGRSISQVRTDRNGVATSNIKACRYRIHIYFAPYSGQDEDTLEYGEFDLPEGETEITIVVGEPTKVEKP